jgi:hypothetical protein
MKRIFFLALFALLVAVPAFPLDLERLEVSAAFTPPHNEPIIQDMVARYKAEADGGIRFWKRVTFDANLKLWFLQDWRTPDQVGHGFPEAWEGSDWNFERVRFDYNLKLGVDVYKSLQVFVEHQKWDYLTEARPAAQVSEYYWMTGIRWRVR